MASDDETYPTSEIGPLIRRCRLGCGIKQTELAKRLRTLLPQGSRPWTYHDINRIEKGKGRAGISRRELKHFAAALSCPFLRLLPAEDMTPYIVLDPIRQADEAREFGKVLEHEGRQIEKVLTGWGQFLPCSLETESFLKAHHAAIFNRDRLNYPADLCAQAASVFNEIGLAQLERFHNTKTQRPWTFKHLMFAEDIKRIVEGLDEFARIPRAVRRDCIDKLATTIGDERNRVELWLADRVSVLQPVQTEFASIDSLVAFDRRFAFWRSHLGQIHSTTEVQVVEQKCRSLDQFLAHAQKWDSSRLLGLLKNA